MSSVTTALTVIGQGQGQPSSHPFVITPSDALDLRYITRAIRVGTAGDLAIKAVSGEVVVIPSVLAGETLPVMAMKIYATGTTATGIVGYA